MKDIVDRLEARYYPYKFEMWKGNFYFGLERWVIALKGHADTAVLADLNDELTIKSFKDTVDRLDKVES